MVNASSIFKFFRAAASEHEGDVLADIFGALKEWAVGGPARQ
jgi:hypothetical protein